MFQHRVVALSTGVVIIELRPEEGRLLESEEEMPAGLQFLCSYNAAG